MENELIDRLRIPVAYLANLLTAGDEQPVRMALKRLVAIRHYMRSVRIEDQVNPALLEEVDLTTDDAEQIYRLLALAPYAERFVLPTADREQVDVHADQGRCGFAESI